MNTIVGTRGRYGEERRTERNKEEMKKIVNVIFCRSKEEKS